MTAPFYTDDWLTLYGGDCREVLASLPADSVDCVVTSPPYWGLRDYGNDGQLGLERTPEEYVANMVAMFREVRRVLKPSGTCWLNLGSSYYGGGRGGGGSYASERAGWDARPYGSDGKPRSGYRDGGSSSSDLCDGCRASAGEPPRTTRNGSQPAHGSVSYADDPSQAHTESPGPSPDSSDSAPPSPTERSGRAMPGLSLDEGPADELPPASQESMPPQSSQPPRAECSHCDNCGACLSVLRSSSRDARECVRKTWPNVTRFSHKLKPKDDVMMPHRVAMALQEDGWFVRSEIVWGKPNPMPESVTDRPTKSHEMVFLLTKQPRYYFDADAVRESLAESTERIHSSERVVPTYGGRKTDALGGGHSGLVNGTDRLAKMQAPAGRNIRSVWNIATRPYPGAHFAVFPPELPERCIKAGSPSGGVVLDPFGGSGTVGMVANRLSRRAILIDLNPEYLKQQMRRNSQVPLGLTEGDAA
jgi:DNA modification methylase